MKTNTFIIIICAYSALLGIVAIFFPAVSLKYFAGKPDDGEQQSLMNFIGNYQIALSYIGYSLLKSTDRVARRAWLMSIAFLSLIAIVFIFYNKSVRMIPVGETYMVDIVIWLAMAAGALYYRTKE